MGYKSLAGLIFRAILSMRFESFEGFEGFEGKGAC